MMRLTRLSIVISCAFLLLISYSILAYAEPPMSVSVVPDEVDREAHTATRLAIQQHQHGKLDDALESLSRALKLVQREAPGANMASSVIADQMAAVLIDQGLLSEAVEFSQVALQMKLALFPNDRFPTGHPQLVAASSNLGNAMRRSGDLADAKEWLNVSRTMAVNLVDRTTFSHGHPLLQTTSNSLGAVLLEMGDYDEAIVHLNEALLMADQLYPADRFPNGSEQLLQTLNNRGHVATLVGDYSTAASCYQRAKVMVANLFPATDYPIGHPAIALVSNNLGFLSRSRGDLTGARIHYEISVSDYQKLYPKQSYPDGHPRIALASHNLAVALEMLGELTLANKVLDRATRIFEAWAANTYDSSYQAELAYCLETRARLNRAVGEHDKAEEYQRIALEIRRTHYSKDRYPDGHLDLAKSLAQMGITLSTNGRYVAAEELLEESLAMIRGTLPERALAEGHPALAQVTNNLACVIEHQGRNEEALELYRQALEMNQRLYPESEFPFGHDHLSRSIVNFGHAQLVNGDIEQGLRSMLEGYNAFRQQSQYITASASEGEAMNFQRSLPRIIDDLLTYWPKDDESTKVLYEAICLAKGERSRVLTSRFEKLRASPKQPIRDKYQQYQNLCRDLASIYRQRSVPPTVRETLGAQKEQLERELAAEANLSVQDLQPDTISVEDLQRALPDDAAVVEYFLFHNKETGKPAYTAFVVRKTGPPIRLSLAPAEIVDPLIAQWREWIETTLVRLEAERLLAEKTILQLQPSHIEALAGDWRKVSAQLLSELLWKEIASQMPATCQTVYLIPDGSLHFIPFNALETNADGRCLIEDFQLSVVPDALWLVKQLRSPSRTKEGAETLLTLGGILYDEPVESAKHAFTTERIGWNTNLASYENWLRPDSKNYLAGSALECTFAMHCADAMPKVFVTAQKAGLQSVTDVLPQASFALLSTHGNYLPIQNGTSPAQLAMDSRLILSDQERVVLFQRDPLLRILLTMSASNVNTGEPLSSQPEARSLTARQICGLPLDNLRWVFLSACRTGLGDVRVGEELYSMPMAFHMAGTQNVIATLWSVSDVSTARIVMAYCYKIFREKKSPAVALREAQLLLLRAPQQLMAWDGTGPPPELSLVKQPAPSAYSAAFHWAGFVLSGPGT